jgi:hypothetical protein
MNIEQAIKILKEYYFVDLLEDGNYRIGIGRRETIYDDIYPARKVIKLAKYYQCRLSGSNAKKNLKHFDKRRNRQRTKEAINHGEFDKIPSNDRIYKEDVWTWD